jgi:F420H(2)-dependent quinone reductase
LRGRFYVIAEYLTSNWVANLHAHPEVKVRLGEMEFAGHARLLSKDQDGELVGEVQALSTKKYGWGDGLVVEIAPSNAAS